MTTNYSLTAHDMWQRAAQLDEAVASQPRAHSFCDHDDCEACYGGSDPSAKATNPKDAIASDKAPLHLVPAAFKTYTALALAEGAMKYGAWNWRAAGVRASVYVSALERHMAKWFNGEAEDPETGVLHLANAAACLAVLIDSMAQGNMTDDRPIPQPRLPEIVNSYAPATINGLRRIFGDRDPQHFTKDQM